MTRLEFATKAEAQVCADYIHQRMIKADKAYATDVAAGRTVAWAIPRQQYDDESRLVAGSLWGVGVNSRCAKVLTTSETAALIDQQATKP